MKEFYKTQKVTYNLMSFTGFKALLIFSMLTEGPKSYKEISDKIENNQYLREKISIDTMRVYINSLKRIGCEIKRIKGEDKISKYLITENPFELKISPDQMKSIIKVYKNISKSMDVKDMLYMDNLFEKIGKYVKNEEFISTLKGFSLLKDIDKNLLKDLIECCEKKQQITIAYNSPNSGIKNIEIAANEIIILNNKIYLNGFGFEYEHTNNFLVSRIKEIKNITDIVVPNKNSKKIIVEYELENCFFEPESYEKIINKTESKILVQAETSNTFFLKQRLLQFGPQCKIISPVDFKQDFISLLKDMKAGYYCD